MADLDDFFAKKDRKKSKSVKKFGNDDSGKKMDDPKQKPDVRPKKERPAQDGEEGNRAGEEEEWKEYEEPVKDYTGLKIQHLQAGNGAQDSGRDSATEESAGSESGKVKGPWNKPQQQQAAAAAAEAAPAAPAPRPPPAEERRAPAGGGGGGGGGSAYVPPSARHRPAEQPTRRQQPKHLPDIHNADYFPSLGAKGAARGGGGGWSTAGAAPPPRASAPRPLALGNRYTQLRES